MKTATIWLPYFKQGDDLSFFLEGQEAEGGREAIPGHPPREAMLLHARMLGVAAGQLRQIAELVGDTPVEICADTHHIDISGPDDLMDKLVAMELAQFDEWDDPDDEDLEEEEDDEDHHD